MPSVDNQPIWSPDGTRIVFQSTRQGSPALYQKPSSGAGREELLLESAGGKSPSDWSPDGRFLINTVAGDDASSPITLIQNWKPPAK